MADSRPRYHPRKADVVLLALFLGGCGWHVRPPAGWALAVAPVGGATVETGERASVEQGLILGACRRGIAGDGPVVRSRILDSEDRPEGSLGGTAGSVAWTARLVLEASIPSRTGCTVHVSGRRTWTVPAAAPDGLAEARAQAHRALAVEVADRALDALLSTPECR